MADINIKFEDRMNTDQYLLRINPSTVTTTSSPNDIALSQIRNATKLLSSGEIQLSRELSCAMYDLINSWNDLEGGFTTVTYNES